MGNYMPTTEELEATIQLGLAVTAEQQGADPVEAADEALSGFHRWTAARDAEKWDEAVEHLHAIGSISAQEYGIGQASNPYRKEQNND